MDKSAKIYVAGHHGLVGSAIWNNLKERGYNNLVGRSHKELDLLDPIAVKKFFDEEQPDDSGCGTCGRHHGQPAISCGLYLPELTDSAERDWREFPSRGEEVAVPGQYLHLSA